MRRSRLEKYIPLYEELRKKRARGYTYPEIPKMLASIRHSDLFIGVITGRMGIGKSSYMLHLLDDLFSLVVKDPEERDDIIIDHVFYDPNEAYREIIHFTFDLDNSVIPIMAFDDAGVWLNGKMYMIDRARYMRMWTLWQLARRNTSNLLLTMPSVKLVPSELRATGFHEIKVIAATGASPYYRLVRVYYVSYSYRGWFYSPRYQVKVSDIRVRDSLYRKYWEINKTYVERWNKILQKVAPLEREIAEEII